MDALGVASAADPTGVLSVVEAGAELIRGNPGAAAIAGLGAIPVFGKLFRAGKRLLKLRSAAKIEIITAKINAKTWQAYEAAIRKLYGEASFESRKYRSIVDGKVVNGGNRSRPGWD